MPYQFKVILCLPHLCFISKFVILLFYFLQLRAENERLRKELARSDDYLKTEKEK